MLEMPQHEPSGLRFEMYDDLGRFRTEEELEYQNTLFMKLRIRGHTREMPTRKFL